MLSRGRRTLNLACTSPSKQADFVGLMEAAYPIMGTARRDPAIAFNSIFVLRRWSLEVRGKLFSEIAKRVVGWIRSCCMLD